MKRSGNALAWFFVAACAVAAVWSFSGLARSAGAGGAEVPPGSARRYDPYGTAALAETLRRLDAEVAYLERPRLHASARGVLVRAPGLPTDGIFDEGGEDVYALPPGPLLAWVAEGNVLVSAGRGQRAFAEELGVTVTVDEDAKALEEAERAGVAPDLLGVEAGGTTLQLGGLAPGTGARRIHLRAPASFEASEERPFAVRAFDTQRRTVAAVHEHGEGLVVFLGAPDPFQNAFLGEADHLALVLDLLRMGPDGGAVWFDEWAHGLGHAGTLVEVLVTLGLVPLGVQGGLWLLAYAWSHRGRRPLVAPPEDPPAGGAAEQAAALGRLVRAHTAPADAATEAAGEVRHRLAAALKCAPAAVEDRLREDASPAAAAARSVLAAAGVDAARSVPRCRACRFPLRGGAGTERCPECGEPLSAAQRRVLVRGAAPAGATAPDGAKGVGGAVTWASLGRRLNEAADAAAGLAAQRQARSRSASA